MSNDPGSFASILNEYDCPPDMGYQEALDFATNRYPKLFFFSEWGDSNTISPKGLISKAALELLEEQQKSINEITNKVVAKVVATNQSQQKHDELSDAEIIAYANDALSSSEKQWIHYMETPDFLYGFKKHMTGFYGIDYGYASREMASLDECSHQWKHYQGFTEEYTFCEKCEARK